MPGCLHSITTAHPLRYTSPLEFRSGLSLFEQPFPNVPEDVLLMLPTASLRKVVANTCIADPKDMLRSFLFSESPPYPVSYLFLDRSGGVFLLPQKASHDLAVPFIRKTNNACLCHGCVRQ